MGEIRMGRAVLGAIQTNCYFVYREDLKEAVVVDPADAGEQVYNALRDQGLKVAAILLTHGHFDHIYGVDELRRLSGCNVYAWEAEKALLEDAQLNSSAEFGRAVTVQADQFVKDGELMQLGGMEIRLLATPGHTQGSCCYYIPEAGILFSGDTLFEGSVGRTDFPTGDMGTLVRSLNEKLRNLPEETQVFPGHGGSTTIGDEIRYNPYLG